MRRAIVAGAVVLIAAAGAGYLLVRWALEPGVLKSAAESRLAAALGQPVRIGTIRLSFLPPISLEGTNITVGAGGSESSSLEIGALRIYPRFWSIFRKPIVIDRVNIERLVVHAERDASGHLMLPLPGGATSEASQAPGVDVERVTLKEGRLTIVDRPPPGQSRRAAVSAVDNVNAVVDRAGPVTRLDGLTASVGRSQVSGSGTIGSDGARLTLSWTHLEPDDVPLVFALLGARAPEGLSVAGRNPLTLDVRVAASGDVSAAGKVAADRVALGTLALTSFQSPLAFAKSRLALDQMKFQAYSGSGRGRATVNLAGSPFSWTLDANLQSVDIDRLVSENTTAQHRISGTGTLGARVRGTSRPPITDTLAGTASVDLANGVVRDFPLLSAIYSALRIGASADRDLHFQRLAASFTIADARATTSDLAATSGELRFTAAGSIAFDQALNMKGVATFSRAKSDEFIHSIRELSSLANASGEIEVPFTISGSASAPHFAVDVMGLAKRGVEQELKRRLGDRLKDLFKKKR